MEKSCSLCSDFNEITKVSSAHKIEEHVAEIFYERWNTTRTLKNELKSSVKTS